MAKVKIVLGFFFNHQEHYVCYQKICKEYINLDILWFGMCAVSLRSGPDNSKQVRIQRPNV